MSALIMMLLWMQYAVNTVQAQDATPGQRNATLSGSLAQASIRHEVDPRDRNHPEYGKFVSKTGGEELIHLRDEYSKYFKNPDGSFTKGQGYLPLHYKDSQGIWRTYVDELKNLGDGNFGVVETDLPVTVNTGSGLTVMQLDRAGNTLKFGSTSRRTATDSNGEVLFNELIGLGLNFHANSNTLVFENGWSHTDKRQRFSLYDVETDYVIHHRPSNALAGGELMFTESFEFPAGWTVERGDGLETGTGWKGELILRDQNGDNKAYFRAPVYYDSNTSRDASDNVVAGEYRYQLSPSGILELSVVIAADWLLAEDRIYPVTIDPTVSGTQTGTISLDYGSAGCSTNFNVNVPAGTVTGYYGTWSIYAYNGAWMSEQRSRIGVFTYQTTYNGTGGNAGGTNNYTSATFGEINGAWGGGNRTFYWQGWRTWGGSGCNTTYQYRTGNWIVYVNYDLPCSIPSSPTVGSFGSNTWNVYCYNSTNFTSYQGYYTENGISFNSTGRWGSNGSPSSANGTGGSAYSGCPISADNHSFIYKRQGFTAGFYTLDVSMDDQVYVYVNGTLVYSQTNCCQWYYGVWSGYLDGSSQVEIQYIEFGGGSFGAATFNNWLSVPSGSWSGSGAPPGSGGSLNRSVTACSGTIYDHGGPSGNYRNYSNGTMTIYPTAAGDKVTLSGSTSGEGCCDFLRIYNGVGTGGTLLWSGVANAGAVPLQTSTDAGGALTVQFTSDVSVVGAGFALNIGCITPCTPQGDQITYGSNSWIGYVYDNTNFTTYRGFITQSETFDQNFGGDDDATSFATNGCPTQRSTFSVRYKMRKNFACGIYQFRIGGDDGVRLNLNGSQIINGWVDQGYTQYTSTPVYLNGNNDLDFEYYENASGNRATFEILTVTPTVSVSITQGTSGFLCSGSTLNLTASGSVNYGPAPTYSWTGPGGYTASGASMSRANAPEGTYTVTATHACGQTSTASYVLTLNPSSIAPTGITGTTSICGGSTTLSASGGMIAYYPFSSNLNDASGSGLHLSGSGGSFSGGGLQLTTGSTYTSAVTSILNTDFYTISFDMMYTSNPDGSWRKIFGFNAGGSDRTPGLWKYPGEMRLHWRHDPGNTGLGEGQIYNLNQWYTVVGEKNGSTFSVYVNGVLVDQGTVANPKTGGTAQLWFGGAQVILKEFKVYNGVLRWFSGSCGGTAVGNGPTVTLSPPVGTTNYFVRNQGLCNTTGCASVSVTNSAAPAVNAGSNVSQCGNAAYTFPGGAATASGTYSGLQWTASVTSGSGSLTAGQTTLTPTFTPSSATGSVNLTLTATGSGACAGVNPSHQMTFSWVSGPSVNAGPDNDQCGTAVVTLTGSSASTPGSWSWSIVSGGWGTGTITNGANPAVSTFTPTSPSGRVTLRLSNTGSGSCGSTTVTDDRVISWNQTPSVSVTSPINSCTGSSPISIANQSANGTYGSISWSGGAGTGTWPTAMTGFYDNFTSNTSANYSLSDQSNTSWNWTDGTLWTNSTPGGDGYSYARITSMNVVNRNIVIEYDMMIDGTDWGGIEYRGIYCDINSNRVGWRDDSQSFYAALSGNVWHHVKLEITMASPYPLSTLTVDGTVRFSNEPIQSASWPRTDVGLVSSYYSPFRHYFDNLRVAELASPVTYTPNTSSGSFTAFITANGIGPCASSPANGSLTVNWGTAPSVTSVGTATTTCGTAGHPMTGAAASGSFGSVSWSGGGGLGTWSNTSTTNPAAWTFTPSSSTGNSFTATLTVTGSGGCIGTNATATRTISWTTPPSVSMGSAINSCAGASAIPMTGSSASNIGSYTWSGGAPTYGSWNQGASVPTAQFTPNSSNGSTTVTLSVNGTGACSAATASGTRSIAWNATPTATAGAATTSCGTAPHPMTGATASGSYSSISWSGNANGSWTTTHPTDPSQWVFTPTTSSGSFTSTLTLTGSGACVGTNPTVTRLITWQTPPSISAGGTLTVCSGTGAISMTGATSSSTGAYTWSGGSGLGTWNQGGSIATATFTPSSGSGSFVASVSAPGTGACSSTNVSSTRTITWTTAPVISSVNVTNVTSCATNNGIISINASGVGPLSYSINNGATYGSELLFDNLAPGSYNIIVRDANNCTRSFTGNPVTISPVAAVNVTSVNVTQNVTCGGGDNGSITISGISGGTPNYEYTLYGPASDRWESITTLPNYTITGLPAGTYQIVVRDRFGCMSSTFSRTITQPTPLTISALTVTDIIGCGSSAAGAIAVTATGGTGALTFTRNNTASQTDNTAPYNANWTGLVAGTYEIKVTDAIGCEQMAVTRVSANWVPTVGSNLDVCSGSSVQLQGGYIGQFPATCEQVCTSACGVPSHCAAASTNTTDDWINGVWFAGIISGTGSGTYTDYTGGSAALVYRGSTYTFQVQISKNSTWNQCPRVFIDWNRNGSFADAGETYDLPCSTANPQTQSINITVPAGAALGSTRMRVTELYNSHWPDNGCNTYTFGEVEDYRVEVRGQGACVPTVSWSHGLGSSYTPTVSPTANTTYTMTINDGAGCIQSANVAVRVSTPNTSDYQNHVSCNGENDGCVLIQPIGGMVGPYIERLSTGSLMVLGGRRRVITINSAAALTNHQVSVDIPWSAPMRSDFGNIRFFTNDLTPIPYWVESYTLSGTAKVWLKVPSLSAGSNTIQLVYGSESLQSQSNGDAVFEFFDDFNYLNTSKWTTGITNATNGTNWTHFGGTLNGGNQNRFMQSVQTFSGAQVLETMQRTVTSPTNGFMTTGFFASTGDGIGILHHASGSQVYYRNNGTWVSQGSPAASYHLDQWVRNVIIHDNNTATVRRFDANNNLTWDVNVANGAISNERIRIGARYDNGNYDQNYDSRWDWMFVRKYAASQPTASVGAVEAFNDPFCGLGPGNHTVTMRDMAGCVVTRTINITQPNVLSVTQNNYSVICPGASNGTIDIDVTGGTPNYSYIWAGPGSFSATTQDITGRPSGTYNVTTADNNGCTATRQYAIYNYPTIPAVPSPSASASSVCSGGTVTLSANGLAPGGQVANFTGTQTTSGALLTAAPNNFTMELWVNPTATRPSIGESTSGTGGTSNQRYAIFSAHGSTNAGAGISVGTNGISVLEHGDGYLPALLEWNAPLSGWTHVAVVYTNKTPSLYVNGNLVKVGLTSLRPNVYPSVGTGSSYGYYAGALDNVRIWNTSRTAAEIQANMYREDPTVSTGLIAHYKYTGNTNASVGSNLTNNGATFTNANHFTYTWSGTGAPSASTNESQTTAALTTGTSPTTINYTVTATASGCAGTASTQVPVTVNPVPAMTSGNAVTICSGTGANLTLTANPASTFSWTIGTITGSISGASASSGGTINQTLTNPGTSNGTVQYLVTPTATTGGCAPGTPQTVTVTVRPPFNRGTIPSTGETICYGGNPGIIGSTVNASGGDGNITYEWRANGVTISPSNAATYDPPGGLTATTTYTRFARDGVCTTLTQSIGSWTVIVNDQLTAGSIGTSQSICYNTSPAGLTQTGAATGGTGSYTYQWQSSPNGSTWTDIPSANSATYSPGNLTATTHYRRNVTSGSCGTVSSNVVIITVADDLVAGTISGSNTVCQGQNAVAYSIPSIPGATGYTWTVPSGATIASGAGTASITVNYSASAVSGNVTVTGTNACGSGTVTATRAITVNPLPVAAGTISGPTSVCQGQTGVVYTVPSITNATGYTWTLPTGASITAGSNTNSITVSFSGSATSGNVTVRGTNACGNGVISANYAVTVNPTSAVGAVSANQTICSGTPPADMTIASSTGTVQWQMANNGTFTTGLTNVGTNSNTLTGAQVGNLSATRYFRAVVTSGTCAAATSGTITVTVNPVSVGGTATAAASNICSGSSTSVTVAGHTGTIQWQQSSNGTTGWANVSGGSGATTATYTTPNLTATTYYRAAVTSSPCTVEYSSTVMVTVTAVNVEVNATAATPYGCYATVKSAFDAINLGTHQGAITIKVIAATVTETAPAVLYNSGVNPDGTSSYTSVHMYPTASNRLVTGAIVGALIDLDGADNVRIDGKVNGTGAVKNLILRNTSTDAAASNIRFVNSAEGNTVEDCILRSRNRASTAGGTVFFSNSPNGGNGNSNNSILRNDIHGYDASSANRPRVAIYSNGTATSPNASNTIHANNFINFLANANSWGVRTGPSTTNWTISSNHFYQTDASFPTTAGRTHYVIDVSSDGSDFVIEDNVIGGQQEGAGGGQFDISGLFGNVFYGINIGATVVSATVRNNTIKNISHSSTSTGQFFGIRVLGGDVTVANNTIGDGLTLIKTTSGTRANGLSRGIQLSGSGSITASGNTVSGIVTQTDVDKIGHSFYGIDCTTLAPRTLTGNVVGSETDANSIVTSSIADSTLVQHLYGIVSASEGTISANTIANISNGTTGTAASHVRGILISAAAGNTTVSGNIVRDLSTASASASATNASAMVGISNIANVAGTTQVISGNSVFNLSSSNGTANSSVIGIHLRAAAAGSHEVSNNFVHSLTPSSNSTSAVVRGISLETGSATISNNIVNVGTGVSNGNQVFALWEPGTVNNNYDMHHNTLVVSGSTTNTSTLTYALFSNSAANTKSIRNNILVNSRSSSSGTNLHFAARVTAMTGVTMDYNDYFVSGTGGTITRLNTTNHATLAAWQTATGQNVNSYNLNPTFSTSPPTTLATHYVPTCGMNGANGLVANDYAGTSRANPPSIGAFEVTQRVPAITDIAVTTCSGVAFSVTPVNGTNGFVPAGTTYTWSAPSPVAGISGLALGNGMSSIGGTLTSTNGTPTNVVYTVTPIAGGCTGATFKVTVTVNPSEPASVSIAASASTICPGTNVTFTATPTNGGASPSYQWKIGSTNVGTNSPTFSSNSLVNGNVVTVVMTSNATCPTGSPATSNGITITVISPATPVASVTAQPTCATPGGTITISSPVGASYEYALNGGAYQSSPVFNGLAPGNYSATVRLAASPTCVSPSGPSLTINTTPSALPPMTPVIVCQGGSGALVSNNNCVDNFVAPFPANTIYSGWLASGSPTAATPSGAVNTNVCAFGGPVRTYSTVPFQVSITGNYIFEMNANASYNGAGYIVTGNFTPGSCATGTLVRADNGSGSDGEPRLGGAGGAGNMSLTAGVTYTLVSTTDGGADVTGNTYTWTITPPSGGDVLLNAPGSVQWYTAAVGGSPIYTGETFNPVGVPGSGLANTNSSGTWTYYAACSSSPSCRTAATFQVTTTTTTYNVTPAGSSCYNPSSPVTVSLSGSINGMPYRLLRDGVNTGIQVTGTGSGITIGNTSTAGAYTVVAVISESCLIPMNGTVNILPAPIANAGADVTLCGSSLNLSGSSNGTTIGSEDFGNTNMELTNATNGWRVHYLYGTHPANRTRWYISHSGASPFSFTCATSGSALVTVDDRLPFQSAVPCDYAWDNGIMDELAYRIAPFDARLYTSVNVSFSYRVGGNYTGGVVRDYMQVVYSLDNGANWTAVSAGNNGGSYTLLRQMNGTTNAFFSTTGTTQVGTANVSLPSAVAGNFFLLGFRWTNDGDMSGDFVDNMLVDNIVVTGAASYSWSPTSGVTGANTATPTVTVPTTYTVTVTAGNGCTATDDVLVRPRPQVNAISGTTVCSGSAFTVTPVNGTNGVVPAGTTYSWSAPSVAGITGAAPGTNATSISGTLTNTTNAAINVTYVVTPTGNGCTSTPFNVTVTVNPRPSVTNMTASICSGGSFSVTPVNTTNGIVPAGTTYSWGIPSVTGGLTGGSSATGVASISGTLANPSGTPQTATYTVTASTPSCTASSTFTVTVTVNPTPAVTNMTASACSGAGFSVTPVNGTNGTVPAGTTYSWSAPSVAGITGAGSGTNAASISGTLTNTTSAPINVVYTVTPSVSGCSGGTFTVTATINPSVTVPTVITFTGSEPTCQLTSAGSTTDYNSTSSVGTLQWSLTGITNTTGTIAGSAINSSTGVVTWPNGWSGSVTVNVVSTGCNGPSAATTRTVTVNPTVGNATAPTVVSGSEPICQLTNGTTTTGYGSTATNNTGFNWSISNGSAGSIHPTTGVMTWANGFSGSVDIQVTANGCNGPSAQAVRTVNIGQSVTVPTAITFTGTEPSCQLLSAGNTTDYNSTASVGTLQWSLTGITNSTGTILSSAINATTGIVTWPNGWSGSVTVNVVSTGCNGPSTAVTRVVNVGPTVGAPAVPSIISGSEPPCQLTNGTTTTGYGSTASNSTGFNWSISNPAAGSINPTTGVMTWANGFAGSVNIQVTANGCNGPSAQAVRPVTVSPTVGTPTPITVSAGTEPICQLTNGTTTTTYATTASNSTALNWSISNPAAGSINSSGVMTWANGFYGTVDIRVTASGCNGPSVQVVRTVNVVIGPLNNGFRTWTGLINRLWEVPGNWDCGGVPTLSDRVIIPGAPIGGNKPQIKSGIVGNCYDIELQGSTIDLLEIEDGGTLNISQ